MFFCRMTRASKGLLAMLTKRSKKRDNHIHVFTFLHLLPTIERRATGQGLPSLEEPHPGVHGDGCQEVDRGDGLWAAVHV